MPAVFNLTQTTFYMNATKPTFVFATNNAHKLSEIKSIVGEHIAIRSLEEIGCHADIPETADTLEGNALQKAHYIYDHYHCACFADDTGLEVEALNGALECIRPAMPTPTVMIRKPTRPNCCRN